MSPKKVEPVKKEVPRKDASTKKTVPTKKTESIKHKEPANKVESVKKLEVTKTVVPVKKVEPIKKVEPVKKVEPTKKEESTKKVEPVKVEESKRAEIPRKRRQMYILKTLLLGDGAVGKTAIIQRWIKGHFKEDYTLTIGIDFSTKELKLDDGRQAKLVINDIAGQKRFADIRDTFFKDAAIALLVFDCTRKQTLDSLITDWIPGFIKMNPIVSGKPKIYTLLVANKSDLEELKMIDAAACKKAVDEIKKKYGTNLEVIGFIETSAKVNHNVNEAFTKITTAYLDKIDSM